MLVGVVHRIQHPVHAHEVLRELHCRGPGHAAVGDVEVVFQVVAGLATDGLDAVVALAEHGGAVHVVQPVGPEGQGLAHVADDHAQFRETVEHARRDDAQRVQAGLDAEAVDGAVQPRFLKRLQHVGGQRIGVQVDRRVVRFGGGEDVPELRVGQVLALGVRVDDHGMDAQLRDTAFDLLGRSSRVLRRHRQHAGKARGVAGNGVGQKVVGAARK